MYKEQVNMTLTFRFDICVCVCVCVCVFSVSEAVNFQLKTLAFPFAAVLEPEVTLASELECFNSLVIYLSKFPVFRLLDAQNN